MSATHQAIQPHFRINDRVLVAPNAGGNKIPAVLIGVVIQTPMLAKVRYDNGQEAQVYLNQLHPVPGVHYGH